VFACCRHPEAAHELVALAADTADEAVSKNARVTVHALGRCCSSCSSATAVDLPSHQHAVRYPARSELIKRVACALVWVDVTSQESVAALAAELRGVAIDCLINNAAVNPDLGVQEWDSEIDYGAWHATMNVNVYGVMRVCKALVPNLLLSSQRKLIHISSRAGCA
jgi:NAD(P)-dependent dehydrogenase (short-subunit alcohol dehydrogenase family)